MPCGRALLPVHSAHVGQELEVHYRYHPYVGRKVLVRRVEQRATGQFFRVQGPAGIVVSIAGWMLDPVICAGMMIGEPRVDLAALVELTRLLIRSANPAHSRNDVAIVREEGNEVSQIAGGDADLAEAQHHHAGEFGAVVGEARCRPAATGDDGLEFAGYSQARQRGVDDFTRECESAPKSESARHGGARSEERRSRRGLQRQRLDQAMAYPTPTAKRKPAFMLFGYLAGEQRHVDGRDVADPGRLNSAPWQRR